MPIRAKFVVESYETQLGSHLTGVDPNGVHHYEQVEIRTVKLRPVYSSDRSSENAKFWDASPSGHLELGIINKSAWSYFELGAEYYLDFTSMADAQTLTATTTSSQTIVISGSSTTIGSDTSGSTPSSSDAPTGGADSTPANPAS